MLITRVLEVIVNFSDDTSIRSEGIRTFEILQLCNVECLSREIIFTFNRKYSIQRVTINEYSNVNCR